MTQPDAPLLDLRARATFKHWTRVPLRYCDQDPLGHVNNGAIPMCLEQGRVELIAPLVERFAGPDADIVLARTIIDYLAELTYPGTIEVGTRITRIGNKSLNTAHGVFMHGSERCHGTSECVLVFFDTVGRRSLAPSPALRAALEILME